MTLPRRFLTYFVGVFWVHPSHLEHVFNLLCEADPGPAVGREVDSGDALGPGHLGRPQVQQVLPHAKGSDAEGDVIADDDHVPPFRIFPGLEPHFEGHHAHLVTTQMHKEKGVCGLGGAFSGRAIPDRDRAL